MCRNWPPPSASLPLPPSRQVVGSLPHFLDRRRKLTLFASLARLIASSPARGRSDSVLVGGSVPLPFSPWENLFSLSLTVTRPSVHNRDITNLRPERPGEGRRTDRRADASSEPNGALWIAAATLSLILRQPRFLRRDSIGIHLSAAVAAHPAGQSDGQGRDRARAGLGSLALACNRYVT